MFAVRGAAAARARGDDLPLLAEHFLQRAGARELGAARRRSSPTRSRGSPRYDWPGNVRELENLVRRLVAVSRGTITVDDLPPEIGAAGDARGEAGGSDSSGAGDDERSRLIAALDGNRTLGEAARALGIGRSTLYRWLERHGLKPQRTFGGAPRPS